MSTITKRLESFFKEKGISLRQASMAIGKNHAYFSNALNNASGISADTLTLICETWPELNPYYLVLGKGKNTLSDSFVRESDLIYASCRSIDQLIDAKIDAKIDERLEKGPLTDLLRELLTNDIEGELEKLKSKQKTSS